MFYIIIKLWSDPAAVQLSFVCHPIMGTIFAHSLGTWWLIWIYLDMEVEYEADCGNVTKRLFMLVNKHWEYFQSHIASIMDCSAEDLQLAWKLSTFEWERHSWERKQRRQAEAHPLSLWLWVWRICKAKVKIKHMFEFGEFLLVLNGQYMLEHSPVTTALPGHGYES